MSLAFGLLSIALLYGFKHFAPRLPGVLIMIAMLTWVSYASNFGELGGKIVGDIPAGMPSM